MKNYVKFMKVMKTEFVPLIMGAQDLDKNKKSLHNLALYLKQGFEEEMQKYLTNAPDIANITLENAVPASYRWMVRNVDLVNMQDFVTNLAKVVQDFKGKEDVYKVLISYYALYIAILCRMVDTLVSSAFVYKVNDPSFDVTTLKFDSLGIDASTLKYFSLAENIRAKSIDEWKAINITPEEERYIASAIKRIFFILGF